ncbi:hypothetical protein JTB14_030002 [Gonioctena quinquepunctata]|nr:hypothetical protein JTB14_030002 [Gonioctena quinquepunctata]
MTLPKTGSSLRGDVTNCTVTEHPRLGILAPDDYTNAKHTQNSEIFVEYEGDKSHNEPYTRISRRRRKSKTLGTNEEQQDVSNSGFTGAEKRLWIELYRVSRSTSTQDILQYIRKRPGFNDVECRVSELPSEEQRHKRFLVTAPFNKIDELYNPTFWPSGVGITRFSFTRNKKFLEQNQSFL